jgi:hypothetical protein
MDLELASDGLHSGASLVCRDDLELLFTVQVSLDLRTRAAT